jgi:glycosyltransferase involved in cell wall biosynthesis
MHETRPLAGAPHLSIVSPVYRAEECLPELHRRLVAAAERITPHFELVLVEDRGPDGSWRILDRLAALDPRVKAIRLSRNCGQHYAITAGLDHAQGDWVVVMDCDLQDPPEEIPSLYAKAREGFDVVFARRRNRTDTWLKVLSGKCFYTCLSWLTGETFDSTVANFSISSRAAIRAFRSHRERDRSFPMVMREVGFERTTIDVAHAPRFAGTTSYSLRKLLAFALQNVVAASTRPLVLSVQLGLFIAAASLLYGFSILVLALRDQVEVPGWTTLALLMSFLFGLLFVQLGVIGLYLGRTFEQAKPRPLYHVAEARNLGELPTDARQAPPVDDGATAWAWNRSHGMPAPRSLGTRSSGAFR